MPINALAGNASIKLTVSCAEAPIISWRQSAWQRRSAWKLPRRISGSSDKALHSKSDQWGVSQIQECKWEGPKTASRHLPDDCIPSAPFASGFASQCLFSRRCHRVSTGCMSWCHKRYPDRANRGSKRPHCGQEEDYEDKKKYQQRRTDARVIKDLVAARTHNEKVHGMSKRADKCA